MRVLYFDAFSGVSGDMTVGALLGLGVPLSRLEQELARFPLDGYRLAAEKRQVHSIEAWKFDVLVESIDDPSAHHHPHRSFGVIRTMLETGGLTPAVRDKSLAIFTRLAEAEGHVHGVPPEQVTFHEVGAVDSIVDIVGVATGIVELGIEQVFVSPLPLGSGTVPSQHGIIPVPGPATLELLKGFSVRPDDGVGELVTPTGAAIVSALAAPAQSVPIMQVEGVGYGAGTRTLADRPNMLRLVLGSTETPYSGDDMVLIETNIDDGNPEIFEYVMERLFEAGARDVWFTAVQMKKNRPGTQLSVLGEPADRSLLAGIVLRETSAIGVRFLPVQRQKLLRETISVETEFGSVAVKLSRGPGGVVNVAPEYESCKRVARERDVPLKAVYEAAVRAAY
jgi:uncharacterized protein (TIGR00299 family) protein